MISKWAHKSGNSGIKALILLVFSFLLLIIFRAELPGYLLIVSILIIYLVISRLIQNQIKNQRLLELHQNMNNLLEKSVKERTEQLMLTNHKLEKISRQDVVTDLANRRHFFLEFTEILSKPSLGVKVVIFFIDLDRFKGINDTHGHDVGDRVLIEVAGRLNRIKPKNALLARLGGDEFVLAVRGLLDEHDITAIADQLMDCCRQPYFIEPYHFRLTMSVGIAEYPEDGENAAQLLKNADIAMYHAKLRGSNQYAFFNLQQKENLLRRSKLENLLRAADFDREFQLYYQPQFSLPDRRLIGAEALLRWNHPQEGMIMPGEFIPIAEETGLIVPLGFWIIRQAARQAIRWNSRPGGRSFKIAVNLSSRQLDSAGFIEQVQKILEEIPARRLAGLRNYRVDCLEGRQPNSGHTSRNCCHGYFDFD